jgi:myo-inositol 2-dehydrogenase/D-chiro-inositol 1-dehydrogenase
VPVQIGYNRRFDPAYVAAYEAVRAGELGRLTTVRSTTMDPAPPPPAYVAASGGIFRDCSVHDFDIVCWIVGREVVEVYATGTDHGEAMFAEAGDAATAQTLLSFDDGTLGVVSNTRYNGRGYDCRLELHGSTDSVVAGWDAGVPVRNLTPGETFPHGAPYQFFMDRFIEAYRAELNAFLDVAMGRRASPCTPQEALEVAWIAEAATLSLQQHRPIRMEEVRS